MTSWSFIISIRYKHMYHIYIYWSLINQIKCVLVGWKSNIYFFDRIEIIGFQLPEPFLYTHDQGRSWKQILEKLDIFYIQIIKISYFTHISVLKLNFGIYTWIQIWFFFFYYGQYIVLYFQIFIEVKNILILHWVFFFLQMNLYVSIVFS